MIDISIIIPAFNAQEFIVGTLQQLHAFLSKGAYSFEIIVIDDASQDATLSKIQQLSFSELKTLKHDRNQGKFAAIVHGMEIAEGKCRLFTDADLPYELEAIPYAADLILRRELHIVIGDRSLQDSSYYGHMTWPRYFATKTFSLFVRMLITGGLFDTQCGFKAFRADVAKALFPMLNDRGFAGDVELLWIALSYNLEIKRIPVKLQRSGTSTVSVVSDGLRMFARIATLRWNWLRKKYESPELESLARQDYTTKAPRIDK